MARLGDYIEQIRGVSYKPEDVCTSQDEDTVAILRANNIQDDGLNLDDLVYVKKSKVADKQHIQKGDIVVCASSGSKGLVGKAAIATEDMYISFGAFCKVVRPKKLSPSYVGHYFQSPKYRRTISELSGGANINNIRNEHIDDLDLVIVSEEEQERIINELDVLSNLISFRKQQLSKLDELVKSRFIELFGDVKTNKFGWKKCRFGDVATKITDGEHGTVPRVEKGEGYLYFMARNITKDGNIDLTETSYVPEEVHRKIYKRCNPETGDILLVCVGATIGKCTIVPKDFEEFSMARSVALIKPDRQKVNSTFLISLLKSDAIQNDISNCAHTAAQAGLYTNMIINLDAFLPPIELQNQFAAFVKQIDKSKFEMQKSLEKLETLKKSLMQKYFG